MNSFTIKIDNIDIIKGKLNAQVLKALESCGLVAACYIGTNGKYAPYIEFGTGEHYVGGRRTPWVYQDASGAWHKTKGNKPQPFIRPSVADHITEYEHIIKNELKS